MIRTDVPEHRARIEAKCAVPLLRLLLHRRARHAPHSSACTITREPDLLFLYNFNNLTAAEEDQVVPNLGTVGADYDLVLGQRTPKLLAEHRQRFYDLVRLARGTRVTCFS